MWMRDHVKCFMLSKHSDRIDLFFFQHIKRDMVPNLNDYLRTFIARKHGYVKPLQGLQPDEGYPQCH